MTILVHLQYAFVNFDLICIALGNQLEYILVVDASFSLSCFIYEVNKYKNFENFLFFSQMFKINVDIEKCTQREVFH